MRYEPIERRREIGRRIREWRLKRDLSQVEVARVAGITQASLSNYETGKRDAELSTLLGVAKALDVRVGDLLGFPEVVVIRDSRLGRAVERLIANPELVNRVLSPDVDAASVTTATKRADSTERSLATDSPALSPR